MIRLPRLVATLFVAGLAALAALAQAALNLNGTASNALDVNGGTSSGLGATDTQARAGEAMGVQGITLPAGTILCR